MSTVLVVCMLNVHVGHIKDTSTWYMYGSVENEQCVEVDLKILCSIVCQQEQGDMNMQVGFVKASS